MVKSPSKIEFGKGFLPFTSSATIQDAGFSRKNPAIDWKQSMSKRREEVGRIKVPYSANITTKIPEIQQNSFCIISYLLRICCSEICSKNTIFQTPRGDNYDHLDRNDWFHHGAVRCNPSRSRKATWYFSTVAFQNRNIFCQSRIQRLCFFAKLLFFNFEIR